MKMHIYAFGSICRGEIDQGSDVDLLACVDDSAPNIDTNKYSLYRYERLTELWNEGSPFAWHLHLESRLLYTSDGLDFLKDLGIPKKYNNGPNDFNKFEKLFDNSYNELKLHSNSSTFHLSCIFLAIRNFATCYSLSMNRPIFSRKSPLLVNPCLNIEPQAFSVLTRARLLSTRGYGDNISLDEIDSTIEAIESVPKWMETLKQKNLS